MTMVMDNTDKVAELGPEIDTLEVDIDAKKVIIEAFPPRIMDARVIIDMQEGDNAIN